MKIHISLSTHFCFSDPVLTESSVVSRRIKRMGFILPQEEMGKEKVDDM